MVGKGEQEIKSKTWGNKCSKKKKTPNRIM